MASHLNEKQMLKMTTLATCRRLLFSIIVSIFALFGGLYAFAIGFFGFDKVLFALALLSFSFAIMCAVSTLGYLIYEVKRIQLPDFFSPSLITIPDKVVSRNRVFRRFVIKELIK